MDIKIENINDLRLFASYYVEACDVSAKDKVIFINFIKESNEDQIAYLLMKGVMESDQTLLKEENFLSLMVQVLKSMYDLSGGGMTGVVNVARATAPVSIAASVIIAAAAFAATKIYKKYLSKAAKACAAKKGEAKKVCMNKFKLDAMKQRITNLGKAKTQCKKSKNPGKCVQGLDKKIIKLKSKLQSHTP